jgi:exodeoxyribonuclease VII large subunit
LGILRIPIADHVGYVAAITPIAEEECVAESHEEFISITLGALSQELDVAFETFE